MRRALFVIVVVAIAALSGCADSTPDRLSADPTDRGEAVSDPAGSTATSCIETYSLASLAERDYAFDGTVKSVESAKSEDGSDIVTFDVATWFHGGSGATAERQGTGFGTATTSTGGATHAVGDRLLVAGDDDFVWECGFTQPYDAEVAADWKATF